MSSRIAGMADTLKVFGRPFFWVSAPPMRSSSASGDMDYLNGLYKPAVTAAGGHYIDIWNGFTDDNGNYTSSGPDVDGQLRALRSSDGINFTRAGRLKLAFFVEREIRKQTGIGSGSVDLCHLGQPDQPDRDRPRRGQAPGRTGDLAVRPAARRQPFACRRRRQSGCGDGGRHAAVQADRHRCRAARGARQGRRFHLAAAPAGVVDARRPKPAARPRRPACSRRRTSRRHRLTTR